MPPAPLAESLVWEVVTSGGWSGIALFGALAALSVAALALAAEQFFSLRVQRLVPAGLAARVRKLLEAGDLHGATRACAGAGPLGVVLTAGLEEAAEVAPLDAPGWPAVEKAMESAAENEAARLLRRVDYLAVIAAVSPMVGLLGTVVGMMFAFREVAETQGAATAADLASGIFQALGTTVGGLLIAIPAVGAHAILRNRVDAIATRVVGDAESATRPLKHALSSTTGRG